MRLGPIRLSRFVTALGLALAGTAARVDLNGNGTIHNVRGSSYAWVVAVPLAPVIWVRRLIVLSRKRLTTALAAAAMVLGAGAVAAPTAVAAESTVSPAGIVVPIGPGSSGPSVRQWQTDLRAWQNFWSKCRPTVAVDGDYGPATTAATGCFQRVEGIADDGVVGKMTLAAMCFELADPMNRFDLIDASNCG